MGTTRDLAAAASTNGVVKRFSPDFSFLFGSWFESFVRGNERSVGESASAEVNGQGIRARSFLGGATGNFQRSRSIDDRNGSNVKRIRLLSKLIWDLQILFCQQSRQMNGKVGL
jgi:hypothetical protein